jgi:hypothetical protein
MGITFKNPIRVRTQLIEVISLRLHPIVLNRMQLE